MSAEGDKSLRVWFSPLRHVWRMGGAQKPRLAIDGARAPVRDWDPWQRALTTVIEGADRVLVLEDDRIVEGPRDWEFDADHVPRHAAIWRRAQTKSPTAELPSNS